MRAPGMVVSAIGADLPDGLPSANRIGDIFVWKINSQACMKPVDQACGGQEAHLSCGAPEHPVGPNANQRLFKAQYRTKDDAMLDSMRKSAGGPVAKALMGLLVISFAVWGVNDVFRGYSSTAIATVGGEDISVDRYQRSLDEKIRQASERFGQPLTRAQAHQFGLDAATISELVGLAAFDIGAKQAGLAVGDKVVAQNITSDPALAGTFGKFDRENFDMQLQRMGVTEKAFIDDRRKFLVRMQLNGALEAAVDVPVTMVDAIATYQGETRDAAYFILPPSSVGKIDDPDEKTLDAYYKKAAIHFTIPETRDFSIMELNPDDLAKAITFSDEDLKAAYEQRRDEFDVPEKRVVQQIPFATEEAAKAADEKLKSGTPVADIVKGLGLTMSDVNLGSVPRNQMMAPELADAAFAQTSGTYSDPIKGPLGYVILHVGEVTPAVPSTFDSAKAELAKKMASEKAHDEVYDVQNEIEDARAGGMTLKEAAEKNNLPLTTFKGVTAAGKDIDGKEPANLPGYAELMKTVFGNGQGDQIPPSDNNAGGYYWVSVDNITPAKLQPLEEVRQKVVDLWKAETRKSKLQEMAQDLATRGDKGETMDKLAASVGRAALVSPDIKRASQSDTFSRLAVSRLFALPKGGFTSGPVGFGDSMLVMQVKSIDDPAVDPKSKEFTETQTALGEALSNDMLVSLVSGYEQNLGTKLNTELLTRLATENQ